MKEFTVIKMIDSRLEHSVIIQRESIIAFAFNDPDLRRIPGGQPIREENGHLVFKTQGFYAGVPLSMANQGTKVKLFSDWKRTDKIGEGVIQSKYFEKASLEDWKTNNYIDPHNSNLAKSELRFSSKEKELLSYGITPIQMEDRWFMVMEDDVLRLFRSWTGMEIFRAQLAETETSDWLIQTLQITKNPELLAFSQVSLFNQIIASRLKFMKKMME